MSSQAFKGSFTTRKIAFCIFIPKAAAISRLTCTVCSQAAMWQYFLHARGLRACTAGQC